MVLGVLFELVLLSTGPSLGLVFIKFSLLVLLDYHKNACKCPNMNRDMTSCTYRNSTFCCRGYVIIFQVHKL